MYPFSRAFANPQSSAIRDLYKYLSDPEMISFAGGYPDSKLFDVEGLGEASARAYRDSAGCLQYGSTDGTPKLKAGILDLMATRGVTTSPANIVATTGSQQAFDLLLRVFVDPGDVVLVENPTYSSNIQAARVHGARVVAVPSDGDGLDVERLEALLSQVGSGADRPKLLYTVPTFGNPTGATLSLARRRRLLELAVAHQLVIAEDDPYGDLRFAGEPVPSLLALASGIPGALDWVVHMASLSKIIAPGLRVAWSISPPEIARRCSVAKQTADISSPLWTQGIAAEYLASGRLTAHLVRVRAAYGRKCRALCDALRASMGDAVSFHEPDGGMFVWAKLTHGVRSADFLKAAIARKVMFVPGMGFYADDPDASTLRLCFAAPPVSAIQEGVGRLAEAWEAMSGHAGVAHA